MAGSIAVDFRSQRKKKKKKGFCSKFRPRQNLCAFISSNQNMQGRETPTPVNAELTFAAPVRLARCHTVVANSAALHC
jgi:hypothetical protein